MELLRLYFDLTILHACVLLPQPTFLQPNLYSFVFRIVRTTSLLFLGPFFSVHSLN